MTFSTLRHLYKHDAYHLYALLRNRRNMLLNDKTKGTIFLNDNRRCDEKLMYFVDTWKRDITRIEEKRRLDLASRTMKKSWRNETAKYTRNKWHSSRNVICCPRKTIVRDRPVARDGREGVSVRADLERILAGNGQDPRTEVPRLSPRRPWSRKQFQSFSSYRFDVLRGYLRIPPVRGVAIRFGEPNSLFPFAFASCARCLNFSRRLKRQGRSRICTRVFVSTYTCNGFLSSLRCLKVTEIQKTRERKEPRHWHWFNLIVLRSWSK